MGWAIFAADLHDMRVYLAAREAQPVLVAGEGEPDLPCEGPGMDVPGATQQDERHLRRGFVSRSLSVLWALRASAPASVVIVFDRALASALGGLLKLAHLRLERGDALSHRRHVGTQGDLQDSCLRGRLWLSLDREIGASSGNSIWATSARVISRLFSLKILTGWMVAGHVANAARPASSAARGSALIMGLSGFE